MKLPSSNERGQIDKESKFDLQHHPPGQNIATDHYFKAGKNFNITFAHRRETSQLKEQSRL